jgi:hemerythrin-like domain-containing protein
MAVSHNVYIRGLNAIYQQAEGVTLPADIADFLTFCQIWVEVLHHHHTNEEVVMFPGIENALGQEGVMATNLEQHHAFEASVEEFSQYISSRTVETYDAQILKQLIDKFGRLLVQHLHDEINSLLSVQERVDNSGEILTQYYLLFEKKLVSQSSLVCNTLVNAQYARVNNENRLARPVITLLSSAAAI